MAHARMCVILFAGEHAHLLDATDKVPPRVLHFSAFHFLCIWMVLLQKLAASGVGCHWGNLFAGSVCYADDIVLLAPCMCIGT